MGMYTELVLKCEVRGDAPTEVMEVIGHLFGKQQEPESLPNHEFFKCHRWDFIGKHDATSTIEVRPWSLRGDLEIFSHSSLKIMIQRLQNLSTGLLLTFAIHIKNASAGVGTKKKINQH